MSFIDQRQAQKISEWCEKYPKEAEEYWRKAGELSELFREHKISFEEFEKRLDAVKEECHFLESKVSRREKE